MIIISPAKRQDISASNRSKQLPKSMSCTQQLLTEIAELDEQTLTKALNVSAGIGKDAWLSYQTLAKQGFDADQVTACIDLYQGDVYKALDVGSLTSEDLLFMEENLRIISAFYGLLNPFDGIWPYRLEMGSRLPTQKDLAQYWLRDVTHLIKSEQPKYVFNLASVQYAKTVKRDEGMTWCDIVFQDKDAKGQYRVVAIRAKKMRGLMLRYMIEHRVTCPEQLLTFTQNHYAICEAESSPDRLVFRSR